ncbi:MAG: gliding motility-associated C-terminal domain-containing protein [Bacteroidota bacterium]
MKLLITIPFVALLLQPAMAQNFWAKKQAGGNTDETIDVVSDVFGNNYSIGYFSTAAEINENDEFVNGLTDVYVSSVSQNGSTNWVKSFGGVQSDRGLGVAIDPIGNILVCGFYTGSMDLGNGITLTSNGGQDAFLAKLGSNGNTLWARTAGSSGNEDRANAISSDTDGNVIVTGQFSGESSFGNITINASDGSIDSFIAKYDSEGNELWVKQGTGEDFDRGISITTDNTGSIYGIGQFSGDITFDNTYPNTIQNAIYLIKYSSDGSEEWFRWGGGSEESIAYDITSDGSSVYLTGDYGESLSFFGSGQENLTSGFPNSVFILNVSPSGTFNWTSSAGSESDLSSRGIAIRNASIAIAGWFECRLDSYGNEYGEALFRSLGQKDAYCAVYSTQGNFEWARNFGSKSDLECTAITILGDGIPLLAGVNSEGEVIVPVGNESVTGLSTDLIFQENLGITHCDDPFYGNFRTLAPSGSLDGFLLKVLNPNRSPFDFYRRTDGACDLSVPEACIYDFSLLAVGECEDDLIGCPGYSVGVTSFVIPQLGHSSDIFWSSTGSNSSSIQVETPVDEMVTVTSSDGCFQYTDEANLDILPETEPALITDSEGVNSESPNPLPIFICPGETVDITAGIPNGYTFEWSGGDFGTDPVFTESIQDVGEGTYFLTYTSPEGCGTILSVIVLTIEVPLDLTPLIAFPTSLNNDTIELCEGGIFNASLLDSISLDTYPSDQYQVTWTSTPDIASGSGPNAFFQPTSSGWYVVTAELESEENECIDEILTQSTTDSIYVEVLPVPESSIDISGPEFWCPGDTVVLTVEYEGTLTLSFDPILISGDSIFVSGSGLYTAIVDSTNEFGCNAFASDAILLEEVVTPQIFVDPEDAVICPRDSVELFTESTGEVTWPGPSINGEMGNSLFVESSGEYFAEVEFYEGCALVSNTVEVVEFSTPFLAGSNVVLCPDDSVEISVISSSISSIQWLPPLSGNSTSQIVDEEGIYQVSVSACNIVSELEIEVSLTPTDILIEIVDFSPTCQGDSITIEAISDLGVVSYVWFPSGDSQIETFEESGTVFVQVVDSFGCELTSNSIQIGFESIPPQPVFSFEPVCEGEQAVLMLETDLQVNFVDIVTGNVFSNSASIFLDSLVTDTSFYAFLTSEFCAGPIDSILLEPILYPDDPILGSDAPVCTGTSVSLDVLNAEPDVIYIWTSPSGNSFDGSQINYGVSDLSDEGLYTLYANREGCLSDTVGIDIELFETRQVDLPPDTALCFIPDFIIATDTVFEAYTWNDGSNDSIFVPTLTTTNIVVNVTDFNGCRSSDFMLIDFADCSIAVPNIFTPNGDDRNDEWFIRLDRPGFFDLVIYNRWGRIVYESKDHTKGWNGDHYESGEPCSEGVYVYILRINDFEGKTFEQQGDLTLIRD